MEHRHEDRERRSEAAIRRAAVAVMLVAGLALGLTACSDDADVTGTSQGEVSAAMTDDPSSTSGSIARASLLDLLARQTSGSFSGTMDADARVEIRTQSGTWVDVGSVSDADLEMQSEAWTDETTAESRTASDSEVQAAATAFLRASS